MKQPVKKAIWQNQDIPLRGGGWVRTWKSIDYPGKVCVEVDRNVYCNRLTRTEIGKLIERLKLLQKSITPITKKTHRV